MGEKITVIGRGINLFCPEEKVTITVPDTDRRGHTWVFGTTRVGKTRLLENMVEQDIRKGYSVVVVDPKGDIELFSKIVQIAMEEKRYDELILVSPIFPECSAVLDPLSHYFMPEELVGHIISGVEVGKEPYFFNVAYELSLTIVQSLIMLAKYEGKPATFNIQSVLNCIDRDEIANLMVQIESIDDDDARQLALNIKKILNSPPDYFSKVSSSLRVALVELSSGNIGKIIGKADENRFMKRLEEGRGTIMVVQLGSLITRKAAFTLGKVTISMIQSFVGRIFSSGRRVKPPLCLYIDEAQSTLYKGIEDLFAKAGGADVWVHGFAQSINQMYAAVGQDFSKSILDNCNTKVFMRVPDADTADYIAPHFGVKRTKLLNTSSGGALTTRESDEDVVKPQQVQWLAPREFYMLTYAGNYKGRTDDVSDLYLDVKFPDVPLES